jgi:phasin
MASSQKKSAAAQAAAAEAAAAVEPAAPVEAADAIEPAVTPAATFVIPTPVDIVAEVSKTFEAPPPDVEQSVRAALEQGVVESRAAFTKVKASADEAANAFELSLNAAKEGVNAINAKALEAIRTNADAHFEFIKASIAVKSLFDLVALQSEFARKQFEAMTAQAKEISELAQKLMTDTIEPVKEQISKSFKIAV